jgi:hypothetical protein
VKRNFALPFLKLPEDICLFLKEDIFDFSPLRNIEIFLDKNPQTLNFLMSKLLIHSKRDFLYYLKKIGYRKFIGEWVSLYLNYMAYGHSNFCVNLELIEEIDEIEKAYDQLKRPGSMRDYLILFYLKAIEISYSETMAEKFQVLKIYKTILAHLKHYSFSKLKYMDWTTLSLLNIYFYKGENELINVIKKRDVDIFSVAHSLGGEAKKKFFKNFMAYAFSISDTQIFSKEFNRELY